MESDEAMVEVDIPCDVQQEDETGYTWAYLDEARDPSRIAEGAIVMSGDEVDLVFARIVSRITRPGGTEVHLELRRRPARVRRRPPPPAPPLGVIVPADVCPVPLRAATSRGILAGSDLSG